MKRIWIALAVLVLVALLAGCGPVLLPGVTQPLYGGSQRVITLKGWGYQGCTFDRITLMVDCGYPPPAWPKPKAVGPLLGPPQPHHRPWKCPPTWFEHFKAECPYFPFPGPDWRY